jgi:hypothetical protein
LLLYKTLLERQDKGSRRRGSEAKPSLLNALR